LRGFKPNAADSYSLDEKLTLVPGTQEFQFRARTPGKEETRLLTLEYQPPLPELTLADPGERVAGRDSADVDLVAVLTAPDHPHPFRVTVRANATNLLNRTYFAAVNPSQALPGAPRSVISALRFEF
jgi:hypothetical protein